MKCPSVSEMASFNRMKIKISAREANMINFMHPVRICRQSVDTVVSRYTLHPTNNTALDRGAA
jgi:hypothetical protein